MKQIENEYAEQLIEQYSQISPYPMSCAINDVANTLEVLELFNKYDTPNFKNYYQTVLNILKAKL